MPKEASKCRAWEKERRNRLNEAFTALCKLLPCYDPTINTSKIDILHNATSYIGELQEKMKGLLAPNNEDLTAKYKSEECKKLKDRVKRLLDKNEQLCGLLRDAKITIPSGCGVVKKMKNPLRWSNKIHPEQAKILEKKELEKENNSSGKRLQGRKFANKSRRKQSLHNNTPKHRKAILNRSDPKKVKTGKRKKVKPVSAAKCVIVLSQPSMTQPCYVITNAPSNHILGGNPTVITNSNLVANPLVSSKVAKTVPPLSSLGPGALILANGTIMPVLPPPQPVLPIIRQPIILLRKHLGTSTNDTLPVSGNKPLTRIRPKYCFTKTTQVNKVPIPALTSKYANNDIVLGKVESKTIKTKTVEKKPIQKDKVTTSDAAETVEKRKCEENISELKDTKKAKTVKEKCDEQVQQPTDEPAVVTAKPEEPKVVELKPSETTKSTDTDMKKPSDALELNINHSELSNDIFASLQVPSGCQNPGSTSPTAAFLLAFPLVSSLTGVKVAEVTEEDNTESQRGTPTLLQIGTMDTTKSTQSESLTSSLLNLDNLPFFSSKDISGFYSSFETGITTVASTPITNTVLKPTASGNIGLKTEKGDYQAPQPLPQQHQPKLQQQPHPKRPQHSQQHLQPQTQQPPQPIQQQLPTHHQQPQVQTQHHPQPQPQHQQPQHQQPQPQHQQPAPQHQQPQTQHHKPQTQHHKPQPQLQQPQPQLQQPPPQHQKSQPQHQQPQTQHQQPQHRQPRPQHQHQPQSQHQPQPLHQQQLQSQHQKQKQEKPEMVACFDARNTAGTFDNNTLNQQLNYQPKPSVTNNLELNHQTACANYLPQKGWGESAKTNTSCSHTYSIKSYPDPVYTNSNSYSYSYPSDTNFNENNYKNMKTENKSYYSLNYENYADYRKSDANAHFTSNYYSNSQYSKDKFINNKQTKPPINWMTTPDNRLQTPADYTLPQFTKENDFGHNSIYGPNTLANTQTSYFNTTSMYFNNTNDGTASQETRKSLDLPLVPPVNTFQRTDVEDNQFSWSPTKIPQFLDPPSFTTSALPTLVGDLALGTPLNFTEPKTDNKCQKKDTRRVKGFENGQGNFLSVSQLVDHSKESVPARITTRRNSGNRSSAKKAPPKTAQRKEDKSALFALPKTETTPGKGMKQLGYNSGATSEMFCDSTSKNIRNVPKNTSSNYSAEALIGQMQTTEPGQKNRQQNFTGSNKSISMPSFLHDNIIPYFPTVELPQDNNYTQQNQNYQNASFSHNFSTTFQNTNTYTPNTFIPTTTISSAYNFMHDMSTPSHDYSENLNLLHSSTNKDKNCHKNTNRNVREQQNLCTTTPKKAKRKTSNEGNLGFVDFSFLSMPGSINSPILPDDFHTHTGFLQPPTPQLYPCKNPFTKPNDLGSSSLLPLPPVPVTRSIQHSEVSPSINTAGTSLTNFNLSTIFPEINNKGALSDTYLETRIKEHSRNYASTVQVTFNDKPTLSFSYMNTTSQSYNSQ